MPRVSDAPSRPRWRGWLSAARLDLTPLRRYRDYRRLYFASAISLFGSMITMVAAPLQVKVLTGSYVDVGLIGVAEFVPLLVFGLWGGAISDAADRRTVALVTESANLACSALLVSNALLPHPAFWVIYVAAAGSAGATAVQRPSTDAMLPRLVATEHQTAANALTHLQFGAGEIVAPALGGVLAAFSLPVAYGVDVATFVLSLALLAAMAPMPPGEHSEPVTLASIRTGLRYAAARKDLLGTYVVDMVAMAFAMPQALYPFLADQLHAPSALGLLYSAGAVGGVVVTLASGWTSRMHRHGLGVIVGASTWGAGMALAGVAPNVATVCACLALAGGGDTISGIFRGTIWNSTIPDHLRGRLAGIELLSYSSGPTLGNARAGLMARLGGVRFSIGVGGLLCLAGVGLLALLLPDFRRYDSRTDVHAIAERRRRTAGATPETAGEAAT
jgi:MFS family permease